eukprot:scaffold20425_cov45-Attheya_sp.AAC.1
MVLIEKTQIAWWDETHRKCTIGGIAAGSIDFEVRFPRDQNGKIDLSGNGKYNEKQKTIMKVKYEKEVRLSLGCGMVEINGTGEIVGKRAENYDYSGRIIITIKDTNVRRGLENNRVKALEGKVLGMWKVDPRLPGDIFLDDSLKLLKKCGQATITKLAKHGITNIGELKSASQAKLLEITNAETRLSFPALNTLHQEAQGCKDEPKPDIIDYCKADNPYLAKYGENLWEEMIDGCQFMSSYVCVTKMIEHTIDASAAMFKGTKHEDDWYFYHDALSLMTAKDTIEWMKQKDYYKRWILPVNDLHRNDPSLKAYFDRPVGDTPEAMPWDCSLNQDIHRDVDHHVLYTQLLPEEDDQKFSMSTPKRGASAYKRLLDVDSGNSPTSERIIQDINKVFKSLQTIRDHEGTMVEGLGNRGGKRALNNPTPTSRGGYRPRKQGEFDYGNMWIHPDAQASCDVKIKTSVTKWEH